MNKLAIISSRFPYPLDKGDKLRLYYQIRDLSASFEIILISLIDESYNDQHRSALEPYCQSIHTLFLSQNKSRFSVIKSLITGSSLPAQCAYFYNKSIDTQIQKLLITSSPDHIYCQLIRTAQYARHADHKKSIDLMDAFSFGASKRKNNVSWFQKWFWAREENLIKQFEKSIAPQFDNHFIISSLDRERMSYLDQNIDVINNGIDSSFFDHKKPHANPDFDSVFVGNMGYYPNIKAVEYIIDKIIPAYKKRFGESLKVNIAGPNQDKLDHLNHPDLTKSGWYDQVADAYYSGQIFIAPLFEGIGQQNKILEAMALGVPCITSPDVAQALGTTDGEQLLVASSPESFSKHINALISDHALVDQIVLKAKNYVSENFRWESTNNKLISIIKNSN